MLQITIPSTAYFDEKTDAFITTKEQVLQLEHSLVSLARWESKWCKPFLGREDRTSEECADYIRCMTMTQHVDPLVYNNIPPSVFMEVNEYIAAPMTATWFSDRKNGPKNREILTAEIIYYWMIALNVPFDCQKWHLNRLLTLINVCNIKNQPPKRGNKQSILNKNRELNKLRKEQLNTTG